MKPRFEITWVLRSKEPAQCPPDENYPYGIAQDISKGAARTCVAKLKYPAPGVGSWVILCKRCGFSAVVTAAGRADDPTQVTIPCKARLS